MTPDAWQAIESTQDLGLAVWRARKSMGLTQAELATAAGVGLRFMVELEAGKTTVRMDKVLQVLQAIGGRLYLDGVAATEGAEDDGVTGGLT